MRILIVFFLLSSTLVAQQQTINVGTSANDGTGDTLRSAFQKTNSNFSDLYTNKQTVDSDLTTIAGLAPSNDDILQRKSGAWTNRTVSQLATDLQTPFDSRYALSSHTQALSTITQSGATSGQVPTWNGSAWAPATPSTGGSGLPSTTGSINISTDADLLTVASASGLAPYQTITIAGAGPSGATLTTWIESISGTSLDIYDNATASVTSAAVNVVVADQPNAIAQRLKLATAANVQIGAGAADAILKLSTLGGIKLGQDIATDDAVCLSMRTGDMHFPIEMKVGMADFGNGNIDDTWSLQFNEGGVSASHPEWSENIEVFFDNGTDDLIEKNWSYTSIDGLTSYRPFQYGLNLGTHNVRLDQLIGSYRIGHRLGGAGNRPQFQFDLDTTNQTTAINSPTTISTAGMTFNTPPLTVVGNPGTDNFLQLTQSAGSLGTGQAFISCAPTTSTADYVYALKVPWNVARLVEEYRNTKSNGTVERYAVANAADVFDVYEVTGQQWYSGIDYSDSQAFTIGPGVSPGTDNAIRIDKTSRDLTTTGAVSIAASSSGDRPILNVSGNPGSSNFVNLQQSAGSIATGQSFLQLSPTTSTADYAFAVYCPWNVARLVEKYQNTKSNGTVERQLTANAADVFDVLEVTGQQFYYGLDYSDSKAFVVGPGYSPGQENAIRIVKSTVAEVQVTTTASQKLSFWGATPIVQPSGADQAAVTLGNANSEISDLTISASYTQAEVQALRDKCEELADDVRALSALVHAQRTALVNAGLIKGSN